MFTDFKFYLDLDGLFADFDGRIKKLTGSYPKDLTKKEYWKAVGKDEHFFLELDWMADATPLWELVKHYDHAVLTGLPSGTQGKPDKIEWVKRHMGGCETIVVPRLQKQEYAAPNHFLIDDLQSNVDQWIAAGGIGIFHRIGAYDHTLKVTEKAIELYKALGPGAAQDIQAHINRM